MKTVTLADVEAKAPPRCPTCGEEMPHYGGTMGYICCGWKLLYRGGGWFENGRGFNGVRVANADGDHVDDTRLAKDLRR